MDFLAWRLAFFSASVQHISKLTDNLALFRDYPDAGGDCYLSLFQSVFNAEIFAARQKMEVHFVFLLYARGFDLPGAVGDGIGLCNFS